MVPHPAFGHWRLTTQCPILEGRGETVDKSQPQFGVSPLFTDHNMHQLAVALFQDAVLVNPFRSMSFYKYSHTNAQTHARTNISPSVERVTSIFYSALAYLSFWSGLYKAAALSTVLPIDPNAPFSTRKDSPGTLCTVHITLQHAADVGHTCWVPFGANWGKTALFFQLAVFTVTVKKCEHFTIGSINY